MAAYEYGTDDLIDNPTPRVPICLCLDTSGSMTGNPINELNRGVATFMKSLLDHEIARYSADVCTVTFGGDVKCVNDFASLEYQIVPQFQAWGNTPMTEAIALSLDKLEARKRRYQESGVDYYQPWLVVMTDGYPDDESTVANVARRTAELQKNKKLSIFPIGIGNAADMNILAQISPHRKPMKLKGLNFIDFFEWLSRSVIRVSQSQPGEGVKLDVDGMAGWAEL